MLNQKKQSIDCCGINSLVIFRTSNFFLRVKKLTLGENILYKLELLD